MVSWKDDYPLGQNRGYRPCSVDSCNQLQYTRTLCVKHYARARRHGAVDLGARPAWPAVCTAEEGCDRESDRRGLCTMHYARWRRNGTTQRVFKPHYPKRMSRQKNGEKS
ncbi:hypothetical protein PP301_gp080 [Gordonia phage GMA2]|uniref:HNH endonuclease n=1 Tax=Gordonia phage GMA2 TaxID=1647283 RepID=A0A0K0N7C0_9CAUD|nr:hypothetical protein PP301_gp080 [Gordonia phage GMA2]AKJ72642.1 hypothetical protein GMA2_104 [Gordonia phage GMA2]